MICVVGTDATIVNDALHNVIAQQLGDVDPAIGLEDFTVKDVTARDDAASVTQRVLEALNTPPFLVERRVVVLRDAHGLNASDIEPLLAWQKNPMADVCFVVSVVGSKTNKLVKAAEEVIDVAVGSRPKDRLAFVTERFDEYGIKTSAGVVQMVAERLGDDVARADSLARTLQTVYGTAPLKMDHITPYLGDAGDVPEWDLTDAIDRGDVSNAVGYARRMLDSKARSGLQIVNMLQRHYLRMAQLDGSGAQSADQAAELLGIHRFPAEKSLKTMRVLGSDRISNAVHMLTKADTDLKGGVSFGGRDENSDVDVTGLTVIEILVARLAKMTESARRR